MSLLDHNGKPTHIIIHHSESKDGVTRDWGRLRDYHIGHNGWDDIGYHFGVEEIENRLEVMVGRLATDMGAHCRLDRMNHKSIGICLVGNFNLRAPSIKQWNKLVALVSSLSHLLRIQVDNILGHREVDTTTDCPGTTFYMDDFRAAVRSFMETKYGHS